MAGFSYTAAMREQTPPKKLDIKSFATSATSLSGQSLLSNFNRLTEETQGLGAENTLKWAAQGELKPDPAGQAQARLHLQVEVSLPLTCQRCLSPVEVLVQIDQSFRFVATEAQAELEDDASPEDLLVLSPDFDLAALIEDEVLMDLPVVPRHDTCPVALKLSVADAGFEPEAPKPNPFAVLAGLKDRKPS